MTVLTYAQIVTLTEQMVQKSEKSFSKADYKAIVRACEQDVILARLLQAYPPLKFKMFYDRAREADLAERQAQQQARAAHQQQMVNVNVHDPLFGDSRKATRTWLQTQSVVASADSIKASLESEYQPYFLTLFEQQISKGLIGRLYPKSSEEEQRKITQDFRYFVEYLFESYKKGATGGETLIQSVQAALARETEVDKEDALMILFSSLNQARTGYEGSASKYIGANHPLSKGQARDWSCMPGVDERILDGLTPMRLSQEAAQQDESLSIEDRYIQSLAHVFIRKTADGLLPSPLFYSLVLQALPLPATSGLQVEAQESYRFTLAQGVERETVVQQYLAESKKQKDKKLKTIAKALLGKEDYSLVDLHQAVFHQYDGETAQQKAIRLQYKRDLSSLGFEQDLDGTPAEQNSHLEKSINEVLEQRASDFIASVLNMSYESEQEATDYLKRTIPGLTLPGLTLVAAERKDVLVIRNQSGHEQDIAALAIDKEQVKANMVKQTGMGSDWMTLLNHLLMKQGTDAIDSCVASAASGYSDILKDKRGHIDSQAISRALTESKDSLLALGTAYQRAHPEHYFHYYAHDEAIKNGIKAFILAKINNRDLGNDYYQTDDFPCQKELVTEIVLELIAQNPLEDIESKKKLVYWLINQECAETLAALFNTQPDFVYSPSRDNDPFPLILAARKGHAEMVTLLVANGADVNVGTQYGWTALMSAANKGHTETVALLLEGGAAIDAKTNDGWTALMWAVQNGHQEMVTLLLERGADVDVKDNDGKTALALAVQNGHQEMVTLLVENRADVDAKTNDGQTALMWAVQNGHQEMVTLLVEKGADVDAKTNDGQTALMWAVQNGHQEMVKLLVEKGADVDAKDRDEKTVLMYAASGGHRDIFEFLLNKLDNPHEKLHEQDYRQYTALKYAVLNGHREIVELLLDQGVDVNRQYGKRQDTLLMTASESGHKEIVALLLARGADVNVTGNDGSTALGLVAFHGHQEIVKLLVEKGADVNAQDKSGWTALISTLMSQPTDSKLRDTIGTLNVLVENGAEVNDNEIDNRPLINKTLVRHVDSLCTNEKTFEYLEKALERRDVRAAYVFLNRFSNSYIDNDKFKLLLFKLVAHEEPSTLDLLMQRISLSKWFNDGVINGQDEQGKTALHYAIEKGNVAMIEALVNQHGADVKVEDQNGETPIALAQRLKQGAIVAILTHNEKQRAPLLFSGPSRMNKENPNKPSV